MNLIKILINKRYGAETNIYQLPKGLKVIHTKDPKTVETAINIIVKSGAVYDILANLPKGTAHMLEHMLSANPNKYFKTSNSLEKYKQGTITHASISDNAHTSDSLMWFEGSINSKFETRLIKLLYSYIDYPLDYFEKYIEKEREIIVAEKNNDAKKEENRFYAFQEQFIEPQRPGFTHNIIGELDDILKIRPEHLKKLYDLRFSKDNVIVTIQSNKKISKKVLEHLYKIDELIQSRQAQNIELPKENFKNEKKIGYFRDNKYDSIELQFGQFKKIEKHADYKKIITTSILAACINRMCYDILREKYHLIYSWEVGSRHTNLFSTSFNYITLITDIKNTNKLIRRFNKLLNIEVIKFLNSKKGRNWLISIKSNFIYPKTVSFAGNLAFNIGVSVIDGYELHETEKMIETYKNITIEELSQTFTKEYLSEPYHLWIISDQDREIIMKKLKY